MKAVLKKNSKLIKIVLLCVFLVVAINVTWWASSYAKPEDVTYHGHRLGGGHYEWRLENNELEEGIAVTNQDEYYVSEYKTSIAATIYGAQNGGDYVFSNKHHYEIYNLKLWFSQSKGKAPSHEYFAELNLDYHLDTYNGDIDGEDFKITYRVSVLDDKTKTWNYFFIDDKFNDASDVFNNSCETRIPDAVITDVCHVSQCGDVFNAIREGKCKIELYSLEADAGDLF